MRTSESGPWALHPRGRVPRRAHVLYLGTTLPCSPVLNQGKVASGSGPAFGAGTKSVKFLASAQWLFLWSFGNEATFFFLLQTASVPAVIPVDLKVDLGR